MNAQDIINELKTLGSESYRKTMMNHGADASYIGVKISDMKVIQKRVKKNYQLALDLYDSGIGDAMYLAGLIADDKKMTKKDLQHWAEKANFALISEYTVPWVAAESEHGYEMAMKWIDSNKESIASSGWTTLASLAALKKDEDLDIPEFKKLIKRVQDTIHKQPNRVKYVMNGFIISVGGYVKELSETAILAAKKIGEVKVDMHGTACQVPSAVEYIQKMKARGTLGKKRKTVKC